MLSACADDSSEEIAAHQRVVRVVTWLRDQHDRRGTAEVILEVRVDWRRLFVCDFLDRENDGTCQRVSRCAGSGGGG